MFSAIGSWVYRHRRLVLLGWLVLFAVGIVVGSAVFSNLKDSNGAGSSESVQGFADSRQRQRHGSERGGRGGRQAGRRPGHPRRGAAASQTVSALPAVVDVAMPTPRRDPALRATDGSASLIVVTLRDHR